MATLEDAIAIAARAHAGQKDPAGEPYILHPLRVMLRVDGEAARMAAVLHDVVEDSDLTLDDLRRAGIPAEVAAAVDRLTRREDESYDDYVGRILPDALARQVKLADLEDNIELRKRIPLDAGQLERLARYWRAHGRIRAASAAKE